MKKIAIAAAAIGGIILMGGVSARVATAAGPIGVHSSADTSSLVIDVRRGGGRGFRGGGRGFHRGGAWRGRGVGWRGGAWRGGRYGWRGRGWRGRGWRYGHGRRFWRGRWWAYGVGSCWRWRYGRYVWVCGY